MNITMLGTGNALVTECYNTCFLLEENSRYFLVDGGGGSTLMRQLKYAGVNWMDIKEIFITHKHVDHILGIIWLVRMITQFMKSGKFQGDTTIYGHDEVIRLVEEISRKLLQPDQCQFIGRRLHLVVLGDGQEFPILGHKAVAFDIYSTKAKQYGFSLMYEEDKKLTCCGDEPYNEMLEPYAGGSSWLLHEAFCLFSEADIHKPYEKHHSTVKDACQLAQALEIPNLLLYHSEDKNIAHRKELYMAEGREYYKGNLYIPDDLETIKL